jgi:tetratricopeptide (TPR) repeat protein
MSEDNNLVYIDEMFRHADELIKDGEITEAINVLESIIVQEPSYGKAYNHLGWIHETKYKNYKKAEECYKLALNFTPEYPAVYINFVYLLSTLGRTQAVKEILDKALHVEGIDRANINNEFGIYYEQQGDLDKAIDHYKTAIKISLDDKNIDIYAGSIARCEKKRNILLR